MSTSVIFHQTWVCTIQQHCAWTGRIMYSIATYLNISILLKEIKTLRQIYSDKDAKSEHILKNKVRFMVIVNINCIHHSICVTYHEESTHNLCICLWIHIFTDGNTKNILHILSNCKIKVLFFRIANTFGSIWISKLHV